VSSLQQDLQVKEKQYEVKLQALEDSHRQSTLELRNMLAAQQHMSTKYYMPLVSVCLPDASQTPPWHKGPV